MLEKGNDKVVIEFTTYDGDDPNGAVTRFGQSINKAIWRAYWIEQTFFISAITAAKRSPEFMYAANWLAWLLNRVNPNWACLAIRASASASWSAQLFSLTGTFTSAPYALLISPTGANISIPIKSHLLLRSCFIIFLLFGITNHPATAQLQPRICVVAYTCLHLDWWLMTLILR